LQSGDPDWEKLLPAKAAELIKQKGFFGYQSKATV
jgi:hypothetical protein